MSWVKLTHTHHSQNKDLVSKKFCPVFSLLFTKKILLSKIILSEDTLNIHSPQSSISTAVQNQASYKMQYCNGCGSLKTQDSVPRRQSSVLCSLPLDSLPELGGKTTRTGQNANIQAQA